MVGSYDFKYRYDSFLMIGIAYHTCSDILIEHSLDLIYHSYSHRVTLRNVSVQEIVINDHGR